MLVKQVIELLQKKNPEAVFCSTGRYTGEDDSLFEIEKCQISDKKVILYANVPGQDYIGEHQIISNDDVAYYINASEFEVRDAVVLEINP